MKSDLDRLMGDRNMDALIVAITDQYSAPLDYLTGGVVVTAGLAVKARNSPPFLVVGPMETQEAAATGLQVYSFYDLGYAELMEANAHHTAKAMALLWAKALKQAGVESGKVGLYGVGSLGYYLEFVRLLAELHPEYQIVGETENTIFDQAYTTKGADEIARIRSVAERSSAAIRATYDFISSHRAADTGDGEIVVKPDGTPLTIGEVKRFIRRELLDRELEDAHMIFAQGVDAAFPHSRGTDSMPLKLGETIVFDLFPRELGGGYFHDMTRTWCIGYAPDEVRDAYHHVMTAFDIAIEAFGVGKPTHYIQDAVQDYFESYNFPTSRNQPGTQEGYVHGLGHHIGLNVHEHPYFHHYVKGHTFDVGNVITIEPGLYSPERNFGVRVEDTCYVDEHGQLISLTDVPKDLILPLRG